MGFFIGADMLVYMPLQFSNLNLFIPPCVSLLAVGVAASPAGPHWPGRPPFFGAGRLGRGGLFQHGVWVGRTELAELVRCKPQSGGEILRQAKGLGRASMGPAEALGPR